MLDERELRSIEERLRVAEGQRWQLDKNESGASSEEYVMRVIQYEWPSEDFKTPASQENLAFISHVPDDLTRLVAAIRDQKPLGREDLAVIAGRSEAASPGPWDLWLEADAGSTGSNLIQPQNRSTDFYLVWGPGSDLAPDPYWELIAAARVDIPRLVAELTKPAEA
jgi:hypothetical protein